RAPDGAGESFDAGTTIDRGLVADIAGLVWPWGAAATVLCAVMLARWLRTRVAPRDRLLGDSAQHSHPARRQLMRRRQSLSQAGFARARGVTLEAFAHDLAANGRFPHEIVAAFAAYQQVRFGGMPFDDARRQALLAGCDAAVRIDAAGKR